MQKLGVNNAIYLPNFKKLNIITEAELCTEYQEPYKLCTFSRVMKEKGIEDAIDAVRAINVKYGKTVITLDIYGPAEEAYFKHLEEVLAEDSACSYCGVVAANESVEALKDYYALLFPTHWKHEGIPGTIIDALSAGVPIIARRWQYCDEMITDGETGLPYDFEKPDLLKNRIEYAISHPKEITAMKKNCLAKASLYSEDYVMKQIAKELGIA